MAEVTQRSHGYGVMLGFTLAAILAGILLIALEMNEYGWENQAKITPAPKVTPIPPPEPTKAPAPVGK
jgi:hypothetical protein